MASTSSSTPLWEQGKENTAPLKMGRNVEHLEQALSETDDTRQLKERKMEQYEQLVQPSEQEGFRVGESSSPSDDPLINWLGYIKYHQQSFPSKSHDQFLLMERCVRALAKFQRYANDVRFIRLCCQYAEKTERPNEIFKYLYQQKIGIDTAIFWIAWGFLAEKRQEWKFANDIYSKGIRKRAKPVEKLNKRYREFQRRMARHWLNATQTQDEDDDEEESGNRGVLGSLTKDAVQRNDRSSFHPPVRTSRARQLASASANTNSNTVDGTAFAIFHDSAEGGESNPLDDPLLQSDSTSYRPIEREQDRKKENVQAAERWNERAPMHGRIRRSASKKMQQSSPFAVYIDEECAQEHRKQESERMKRDDQHRRVRDERTFREREDLYEGECLVKDPLRYIRDPAQLALDQNNAAARRAFSQIPQESLDARRKANAGFSTRLLRNAHTGVEQCFEEARALAGYYKLTSPSGNFNYLRRDDDKGMQVDREEDDDISMTDSDSPNEPQPHHKETSTVNIPADHSVEGSVAQNASTASSTVEDGLVVPLGRTDPTINTQIAMKELSMMFSSPAVGLNDSASLLNQSGGLGPILNESGVSEPAQEIENQNDLKETTERIGDSTAVKVGPKVSGFTIYTDEIDGEPESKEASQAPPPFTIFDERKNEKPTLSKTASTATGSMVRDSLTQRYVDITRTTDTATFTIFRDEDVTTADNGDTASLSLFDEAMRILDESCDSTNEKRPGEHVNIESQKRRKTSSFSSPGIENVEAFGDISCILPSVDNTEMLGSQLEELLNNASEYDVCHKKEIKGAIRSLSSKSAPFPKNSRSLGKILSTENLVCSLPSHVLPKPLQLQKSIVAAGTKIALGKSSLSVKQELGRGAYGCVCLLEPDTQHSKTQIAVKAQAPVGSLAWEYEILQRLHKRFLSGLGSSKRLPFPKPLSFVSLADGAFLTMEAISTSGLNFVDLVNVYRKVRGEPALPELLALHYVSRMIEVLENLHWFGHVLHCDTKADNWVISPSNFVGGETIDGSNVTLTDFGRAIDLEDLEVGNPLDCKLKGRASRDDMMCVAMRNGLPWSFDIDTYGLCDTAHVILFGCGMEIGRNSVTGRFAPKQKFRRYHQKELWSLLFDTLLNLEEPSKTAIGSRPGSLRQVRSKFDAYLREKERDVKLLLKQQAGFLPQTRLSLSPRSSRKS